MKYPVIIHVNDEGTEYGVTIPDFPGVFSGGSSVEECLENLREAIVVFFEGMSERKIPVPRNIADVLQIEEANGAFSIILTDVDTSLISPVSI